MLAFCRARLEDGVIDADVFALWIEFGEDAREVGRSVGGGDGLEMRGCFRQVFTHRVCERARRPDKNAAVPVVVAGGDEFLGAFTIWLLGKAADADGSVCGGFACFNVAVAGFGACGLYAEHDHVFARGGDGDGLLDHSEKHRLVGDGVVRWEHAEHRIGRECVR